jgi:hypothetical protein
MWNQSGLSLIMLKICCENCQRVFPSGAFAVPGQPEKCGNCSTSNYVEIFPAILKEPEKGKRGERVLGDESACFKHPEHAAVVACDNCGIYLCALCDLEIEGQHLCPDCLNKGKENLKTIRDKCVLHDETALALAIFPMLIFYFVVITAPVAIVYSIVCWNKVNTPYPRNRWRFVVALIIASLQIIGIAGLIIGIASN